MGYIVPSLIVLVLLAVPPILTNTYAGVRAVDAAAVDAAKGMGFRTMKILTDVQLPCSLPLVLSGVRSALLQIISTATIAAYISLGGLGRLLIDGKARTITDKWSPAPFWSPCWHCSSTSFSLSSPVALSHPD